MPASLGSKKSLTLAAAKEIAAAAEQDAAARGLAVVIAVVDDGANLIYLARMDGSQLGAVEIATAKAQCAVKFKRPTKAFADALAGGRTALLRLPGAVPFEGGVPLVNDGQILGAIGVSGASAADDGLIAKAGVDVFEPMA